MKRDVHITELKVSQWLPQWYYSLNVSLMQYIICEEKGWRLNNHKTNKGNGSRSICTFLYLEERQRCCYQPQTPSSVAFNITVNTSVAAPSLSCRYTAHTKTSARQRDPLWCSNRVYSSFLSLVKRWQIHVISAVWCYMDFTRETLSSPAQMSMKSEPSHSHFCLIEALRGKLNNSLV